MKIYINMPFTPESPAINVRALERMLLGIPEKSKRPAPAIAFNRAMLAAIKAAKAFNASEARLALRGNVIMQAGKVLPIAQEARVAIAAGFTGPGELLYFLRNKARKERAQRTPKPEKKK